MVNSYSKRNIIIKVQRNIFPLYYFVLFLIWLHNWIRYRYLRYESITLSINPRLIQWYISRCRLQYTSTLHYLNRRCNFKNDRYNSYRSRIAIIDKPIDAKGMASWTSLAVVRVLFSNYQFLLKKKIFDRVDCGKITLVTRYNSISRE